jgi:hypothetical protein
MKSDIYYIFSWKFVQDDKQNGKFVSFQLNGMNEKKPFKVST